MTGDNAPVDESGVLYHWIITVQAQGQLRTLSDTIEIFPGWSHRAVFRSLCDRLRRELGELVVLFFDLVRDELEVDA